MSKALTQVEEFSNLDIKFHIKLAEATQNPLFELFLKPYFNGIVDLVKKSNVPPERTSKYTEAHKKILQAVESGNSEMAVQGMLEHLTSFKDINLLSTE
ncbi:MAG: hypothetical protein DRP58_01025 [Spirochaetes bacterium]|nr:MAG: hypothetical protein DRP58_01025 [Spirochaetota bacterium]